MGGFHGLLNSKSDSLQMALQGSQIHICQFQIGSLCFTELEMYLVTLCTLPWTKIAEFFLS